MLTPKHTPGPWTHKQAYEDGSGSILGKDGKAVATITSNSRRPAEEKKANARVIASLPDLLEWAHKARGFLLRICDQEDGERFPIDAQLERAGELIRESFAVMEDVETERGN